MRKKIMNFFVWVLLASVGDVVFIAVCLAIYLNTAINRLPFFVGLSIFVALFCLMIKGIHTLGSCMLSAKPREMKKCLAG